MDFLQQLNEAQKEAVMSLEGPQLVIAGAGSGKTRVLTYRLAFIIDQGLAEPQELLALTFTNKAAREMKERIFQLIGPPAKSIVMGTFHSIFSRILRIEANHIGYTSAYTIYDADDSQKLIKTLLKERQLDDKVYKPKVIQNGISTAKNRMISPKEYEAHAVDDFNLKVAQIYAAYNERLFKSNAMDFDDLLIKPILLFQSKPEILYKYQHRFKYIMVDEYQDTNHAQYQLTNMLAAAHQNICVVGDDAQSIYAFRGADIGNILNLKKDYPDLVVMKLEQNYRSTKIIVEAANDIIAKNQDQIQKKVFTENESGQPIVLVETVSEQAEARLISDMIREQKQMESFFNRDFAILYRTNAQSRALEDELRRSGLAYKVFGGLSFYQRKEIKDMVAYFKLAVNPQDEAALRRVINYPTRGIGKTSFDRITVYADQHSLGLWETIEQHLGQIQIGKAVANKVQNFVYMIKDFGVAAKKNDAYHAAAYIAKHSGVLSDLHSEDSVEGLTRWENVQELLNSAQAYVDDPDNETPNLEAFLADISLFTDQDAAEENPDYITLMTIHSAKGLEFKSVFLVGLEENIFPSGMAIETKAGLEEERRLFYVAVTRAEKRLTMSYARSRYRFGDTEYNEPSRFLYEVDPKFIKRPEQSARRELLAQAQPTGTRREARPLSRQPNTRRSHPQAAPSDPNFAPADPKDIAEGQAVKHQKFGTGTVEMVEGSGAGRKATVIFKEKGKRVLLLKYARLQILGS
jgi:DNA helicase II / ATP-dependent DNA helicase PcrA